MPATSKSVYLTLACPECRQTRYKRVVRLGNKKRDNHKSQTFILIIQTKMYAIIPSMTKLITEEQICQNQLRNEIIELADNLFFCKTKMTKPNHKITKK